ncbi:hypothetical protein GLOIN_2v1640062 [Rhizophagus irregularis DAOM 181602=DAOM 197198]|uniref:Uncharacterized protein n=1 Tax=Rhizophagus irregularis (strain DAOM 181602 / DAOM 197198 / MUCL 43194) TaxID=747089 RepID=A0A2P4PS64_RHIID|nr:hypothetical protein GLOIN_2v1640062 [Rhizophagus irregularis DAOM 181602=DAOM 197198]POG68200.1 hypothetical protein GLOIN_2v1640062 [Rhizophagus irregularis DAOM 181602=DAOM 197198]GET55360.1 hypothetical protein GLOIN_2v1640062 [Rhizophagus irregularis DAOM 181602=DAOM 197198]|eukprot:XP_025175066.1 hypothetical protein GLOIN_2v1640062 [Rhizophagus irregularis DAOM 181602=DAOM 197198]
MYLGIIRFLNRIIPGHDYLKRCGMAFFYFSLFFIHERLLHNYNAMYSYTELQTILKKTNYIYLFKDVKFW